MPTKKTKSKQTVEVSEVLNSAFTLHKAGELKRAEKAYDKILTMTPKDQVALRLMGSLCFQQKKLELAET